MWFAKTVTTEFLTKDSNLCFHYVVPEDHTEHSNGNQQELSFARHEIMAIKTILGKLTSPSTPIQSSKVSTFTRFNLVSYKHPDKDNRIVAIVIWAHRTEHVLDGKNREIYLIMDVKEDGKDVLWRTLQHTGSKGLLLIPNKTPSSNLKKKTIEGIRKWTSYVLL